MNKTAFVSALAAFGIAGAVSAHHAAQAQFDLRQNITTEGKLAKAELISPHSYLHFTVLDKAGKPYDLSLETVAQFAMQRAGLSIRDNLKVGDSFKFTYSPSRNGNRGVGFLHALTLKDGRFIALSAAQNVAAAREQQQGAAAAK